MHITIDTELEPYTVYRLYRDDGAPLYVGCTQCLTARLSRHRCKSWGAAIDYIQLERYWDRYTAFTREAFLIRVERPIYNGFRPAYSNGIQPIAPIEHIARDHGGRLYDGVQAWRRKALDRRGLRVKQTGRSTYVIESR